jgi:DNA-binding transcriptional LysR family regulator
LAARWRPGQPQSGKSGPPSNTNFLDHELKMNQIQAMRVFTRVAETQSFRRAAQQLDVSNALVTRSIAMLEAHLKTRLINRTTRNVSLTEAGHRYLQGCRRLLEELDFVEATVANGDDEPRGTLRIGVMASLSHGLTALVEAFRRRYPRIKLHLRLTEQPVDLVGEGYDAAIVHVDMTPANGIAGRTLSSNASVIVASPDYLLDKPAPQLPADLAALSFLCTPNVTRTQVWRLHDARHVEHQLVLEPVYTVNSTAMLRTAALAGMGVAILPERVVEQDLSMEALVQLLPGYTIDDGYTTVSVIYPDRQYMATKTRAFVEFVLAHYDEYRHDEHDHEAASYAGVDLADRYAALARQSFTPRRSTFASVSDDASATASSDQAPNVPQPAPRAGAPWPFSGNEWCTG